MRVVYENQSTATKQYADAKQQVVQHENREYKKIGKSLQDIGIGARIMLAADLLFRVTIGCPLLVTAAGRKAVRVLFKEIVSGKERVYHYVPTLSNEKQKLQSSASRLQSELTHQKVQKLQSAKFLVSMQFENGTIYKEYLVKTARSPAELGQQVAKISQNFEKNIDSSRGKFLKIHWLVMVKESEKALFFRAECTATEDGFAAGGGGPLNAHGIHAAYQSFIGETGFVKEPQYANGEFLTGANFQPLDGV